MARPKSEALQYFSHDVNATNDLKIESLLLLFKAKGYAFYFAHLEYIYQNPSYELDLSEPETREEIKQIFHQKFGINPEEYDQILKTCFRKNLFDQNHYEKTGKITSNGIQKRAGIVTKKRENMRQFYQNKKTRNQSEIQPEKLVSGPQSKVKKSKVKKSKYIYSPLHRELAECLLECIKKNKPDIKEPNIEDWANTIRLICEIDNRNPESVRKVIYWCQQDVFWKCNILSADKLRIQFDTLELKMNNDKGVVPIGNARPNVTESEASKLFNSRRLE